MEDYKYLHWEERTTVREPFNLTDKGTAGP